MKLCRCGASEPSECRCADDDRCRECGGSGREYIEPGNGNYHQCGECNGSGRRSTEETNDGDDE